MEQKEPDVIIVGAGASGLMAAMELSQAGLKVLIAEASDRIGGRIFDLHHSFFQHTVALGAEFVHGRLPLTLSLLQKAGIPYHKADGDFWQIENGQWHQQEDLIEDFEEVDKKFKALKNDVPVKDFIEQHLSHNCFAETRQTLQQYVEGYYAGDTAKASIKALYKEFTSSDEENFRIEGGYGALVNWMVAQCRQRGCDFLLKHPAEEIMLSGDEVTVKVKGQTLRAKAALVTVSLGVLNARTIRFPGDFETKQEALSALGFGHAIKIVVQLRQALWKNSQFTNEQDTRELGFLFSEEKVGTWWTHYPEHDAVLTGWIAGPEAKALAYTSDEDLRQMAVGSLSRIFKMDGQEMEKEIVGLELHNWVSNPLVCGAYSYDVVNGKEWKKVVKQPIARKIFFAGEGLYEGEEIGTVEAALSTGSEAARKILQHLKDE